MEGVSVNFLADEEIYSEALIPSLKMARRSLWIATANIKDVWVNPGQGFQPLTDLLAALAEKGVKVRLIHSGNPSMRFERRLERTGCEALEIRSCSRNHIKCLIVDGVEAYFGTANLTGAGMGAKSAGGRNFEIGIVTRDLRLVREVQARFDRIWRGEYCRDCSHKAGCPAEGNGVFHVH